MLLIVDDIHARHLALLDRVGEPVAKEMGRMAIEFIAKGTNTKMYGSAAKKLDVTADEVQKVVEGLMYLFTENAKLMAKDTDFSETLESVGLSSEVVAAVTEVYVTQRRALRAILGELSMRPPEYAELEWRADIKLASRSLRRQTQPLLTMRLHTTSKSPEVGPSSRSDDVKSGQRSRRTEGESEVLLQTDPVNLVQLTQTLEGALHEARSQHARRIIRNIK